jgi:hypothetical protein
MTCSSMVAMVLVGVGCTRERRAVGGVRLAAAAAPYERDIPIPAGFRLAERACEDQSTGTRRLYLRHTYEGRAADRYAVRTFYRDQMPRAQWTLVSDGNVKGSYTMRFEKSTEACTVLITDEAGRIGVNTRVQIIVTQEERGKSPPVVRDTP